MMKHLLTLTLLCFGLLAQAQIPAYVPTNGLVGWWPFNGNANDESGNGNHGTVNGATLAADRNGNAGKAYSFDSSSIEVGSSSTFNVSNSGFSVSVWVNNSSGNLWHILGKRIHCGPFHYQLSSNNSPYGLAWGGITQGRNSFINSGIFLNSNQWFHIVGSFDGQKWRLFLNSVIIDSLTAPVTDTVNSALLFGNSGTCEYFKGVLDDIAIYNRALSASEVQQLYSGNSTLNASVTSSVPGKINYQGMAMGTQRKPIKNGSIGLRFSVIDSSPVGAVLFTETLQVTTDSFGIFATQIGGGTITFGKFENIPWSNGKNKFLKVEMDILGGSNYQTMGTTQLVSVPYALHAGSAQSAQSANTLRDSSGNAYQISIVNGQPTLVAAPGSGSSSNPVTFACGQSVTYAGESYPTVQIGNQCWFQKNLNVGTMIQGANDQTNNNTLEKYCYNNDTANCAIYGGLYQWAEAVQYQNGASNTASPSPAFSGNVKGICPTGWHVPSDGEWCTITTFLDSTVDCTINGYSGTNAGGKMKSTSSLWNSPNTGATNSSGFSALPGGYRNPNGSFSMINVNSSFWSSYEKTNLNSIPRTLETNSNQIFRIDFNLKVVAFPLRCLKD